MEDHWLQETWAKWAFILFMKGLALWLIHYTYCHSKEGKVLGPSGMVYKKNNPKLYRWFIWQNYLTGLALFFALSFLAYKLATL